MTPRERAILVAVSICHGLVHCYMLVFPMIYKSLGTALDLKFAGVGFIGMASYLAFGLGALPTGFLCDKLGARLMLVICIAGMAAASVVAVFARSETGVVVALILLGLFGSLYHPAGLSLLSTSIRHLGKGLGIHGMGGTIGDACAPVVAGVVTARLGWSYSYAVLAVAGGILVAFLLRTFRGEPRPQPVAHLGEAAAPSGAGIGRDLILIYALGAFYGLTFRVLMTFFPSYLAERVTFIGDSVSRLGWVSTGILTISLVGPLVGGYLAPNRRAIERNLLVLFLLLAAASLGFYFAREWALVAVAVPAVLVLYSFQPMQNVLVAMASHHSRRGRVYGINSAVSFGIGALGAGIGGVVGEKYGMSSIFLVMLGFCLVEVVLVGVSRYLRERSPDDEVSQAG